MGKRLSDEEIMTGLITTKSQRECANLLGVTPVTISNRVNDPQFKAKLAEYRKQLLDSTSTRLVSCTFKAVEVLMELLDSESELVRYNAASRILHVAADYIQTQDIVARIDKLEAECDTSNN